MSKDVPAIETETFTCGSAPSSNPGSPKNRVKFLCSHGGKILPRPADGHLKYVGGETRVISVPRHIPFQELMKKLTYLIDGEMILKYQVVTEDLDTLISVKSDEDAHHMFDEIDRFECTGASRLRAFLFPAGPTLTENQSLDPRVLEQRYIDAINGIIRAPPLPVIKHHPNMSSACSSPRSPDSCMTEAMNESNYQNNRLNKMHKVRSSPSLCCLNNVPQQQNNYQSSQLLPPQYYYKLSPNKAVVDHYKSVAPERLTSVRSVGRAEGVRYQVDSTPHYYSSSSSNFTDRRMNRMGSPVLASSPRGHSAMRAWDAMSGDIERI